LERVCRAYSGPDVAYRLLQLHYRRAGNQTRALGSSQGRRPRSPSFSSTCHALSLAGAVPRGEPRFVRPREPRCRFVLLAQVCPTAMPLRTPHLRGLRLRSIVRINVHGSKDRAKDASPERMRRSLVPATGACACLRMLTAFPSSASFGHPLSSARPSLREDTRCAGRTDPGPHSDNAPRRASPSRRPGCLSPSRHAKECVSSRRDCSLRPSRRLSRSRRPHFVPCERDSVS